MRVFVFCALLLGFSLFFGCDKKQAAAPADGSAQDLPGDVTPVTADVEAAEEVTQVTADVEAAEDVTPVED